MARLVLSVTVTSALPAEQQLTHHFSFRHSWYQHTEASGQQLPDTDAVGVPPFLWLSRTIVNSHDSPVTLRIKISWAVCTLRVLTHVSWLIVPCAAAQVSFTAFADNKFLKNVHIQCQWHDEWLWSEKMRLVWLHTMSHSNSCMCF